MLGGAGTVAIGSAGLAFRRAIQTVRRLQMPGDALVGVGELEHRQPGAGIAHVFDDGADFLGAGTEGAALPTISSRSTNMIRANSWPRTTRRKPDSRRRS